MEATPTPVLAAYFTLDDTFFARADRLRAIRDELADAARRHPAGDLDAAGLAVAIDTLASEAFRLGEEKGLDARIAAYRARGA